MNFKKTPLSKIFRQNIEEAVSDFPKLLEDLLLINPITSINLNDAIYIAPELAEKLSKTPKKLKEKYLKEKKEILKKSPQTKAFARPGDFIEEDPTKNDKYNFSFQSIFIPYNEEDEKSDESRKYMVFVFDHELGHLLTDNGTALTTEMIDFMEKMILGEDCSKKPFPKGIPKNTNECAADAFACLRAIQRYKEPFDFKDEIESRIKIAMLSSHEHNTTAIFEAIEKLSQEQDLTKLPLKETVKLADQLAETYGISDIQIDLIQETFGEVKKTFENDTEEEIIQKTIEAMMKHRDNEDIYRLGKRFLSEIQVYKEITDDHIMEIGKNLDTGKNLDKVKGDTPEEKAAHYEFMKYVLKCKKAMKKHEKKTGFILNAADAKKKHTQKKVQKPKP